MMWHEVYWGAQEGAQPTSATSHPHGTYACSAYAGSKHQALFSVRE